MTVFCSVCQTDTDHDVIIDHNEEAVVTCTVCSHFIKFPGMPTDEQLAEHRNQNKK